ncbi:MAG: eCIS core domain-containing protein [Nostoc sp.]
MKFPKIHLSTPSNPKTPENNSALAPKLSSIPSAKATGGHKSTQEIEDNAFADKQMEATELKLQAKSGSITPEGQERLNVLQAKMDGLLNSRLEHATRFSHNIANISLRRPDTPTSIQAKLTIGEPGDKYEQEADETARQVVQRIHQPQSKKLQRESLPEEEEELQIKPEGSVQRESLPEEEEELQMKPEGSIQPESLPAEEEELQMKPMMQRASDGGIPASSDLETSIQQARGSRQPLAKSIKSPMEKAFGADFGGVKIHTDSQADRLNQSIQAKAFTTEQDVFFRQGEYNPGSRGGQELIAHELTHVMQQGSISRLQSKPINISPNLNPVIQRDKDNIFGLKKSDFASQGDFQAKEKMRLGPKFDLPNTLKKYNWNWFNLKEDLAYKKPDETEEQYAIKLKRMEELVKYRNVLVDEICQETVSKIKERHKDLDDFDIEVLNLGSVTPTSDIDITFEISDYPQFEYEPVELFNQIFMEKYGVTPGVMLDTNVYTSGFMPAENLYKDKFKQQTAEERLFIDDAKVEKHRIQLALSFLPIRQYFGATRKGKTQWFLFKHKTKGELSNYLRGISEENGSEKAIIQRTLVIPALDDVQAIFEYTENLYKETESEIKNEKDKQILDDKVKDKIQEDSKSADLHLDTQAKDKLYVETLKKVSTILQELKENAEKLDDPLLVVQQTRRDLLKRRSELIMAFEKEQGKALIYANEAYFSGGAAYHVVKGMQGGGNVEVHRQQKMQSILMNIGYKLQHFKHKEEHHGLGRALIDTSKYGQRVSDLTLVQNANSGEAKESLFSEISEKTQNVLVDEIELVTEYKKGKISPNKEKIETPTAKENAAEKDFPEMTMENVENAFLEIAQKTLGPYYWDKYKTKGQLWASKATGYHFE